MLRLHKILALRRLVHGPTRPFATAVASGNSPSQNSEGQSVSSAERSQHALGSVKAVPVLKPVYVALTSLLHVKKSDNLESTVVSLDPTVFNHHIRRDILHLCVVHYRDGLRQGTASTKTRGEVRGSGRKLRPQKGTGKARLGDGGNPMLRGGGVAFGPKPRDFSTKLPRKVIEMGMRVALSAKLRDEGIGFVRTLEWPGLKTKDLAERIRFLGWQKTLFVTGKDTVPEGLARSGSNIPTIGMLTVKDLVIYDILKWKRVVMDLEAVQYLEDKLSKLKMSFDLPMQASESLPVESSQIIQSSS